MKDLCHLLAYIDYRRYLTTTDDFTRFENQSLVYFDQAHYNLKMGRKERLEDWTLSRKSGTENRFSSKILHYYYYCHYIFSSTDTYKQNKKLYTQHLPSTTFSYLKIKIIIKACQATSKSRGLLNQTEEA